MDISLYTVITGRALVIFRPVHFKNSQKMHKKLYSSVISQSKCTSAQVLATAPAASVETSAGVVKGNPSIVA
jgi:hypothetical protein